MNRRNISLSRGKQTDNKHLKKKKFSITYYQGNATQNYNKTPPDTCDVAWMWKCTLKMEIKTDKSEHLDTEKKKKIRNYEQSTQGHGTPLKDQSYKPHGEKEELQPKGINMFRKTSQI